jgi:diguanylate cyclase (GGDEF)-like protein
MTTIINDRYYLIVEKLNCAFAYIKVNATDSNQPPRLNFSYANSAFFELTNFERAQIENIDLEEKLPEIVKICIDNLGNTSSGETVRSELYLQKSEVWCDVSIYSVEPGYLAATFYDISEYKNKESKMRYIGFHDQLTGLHNRYYLETEMLRLDTERQLPISVILADLNGLKMINDTYGHHFGDELLIRVAELLKSICRSEDIICRIGGDEFIVFLPQTDELNANIICERIKSRSCEILARDIPVSMALGVSVKNDSDQSLFEVIKEAESLMYKDKLKHCRGDQKKIVDNLFQTLKNKKFVTDAKIGFVQELALQIGEKLDLPRYELGRLNTLMLLHDIGKVNIIEEILNKRGPLTTDEWDSIKKHPEIGYRIVKSTVEFSNVADDILAHHERWDGLGYPRGLKGEEIPFLARLTAVIDAYAALVNGRPYREAVTHGEAVAELETNAGTQFDPRLVDLFIKSFGIKAGSTTN